MIPFWIFWFYLLCVWMRGGQKITCASWLSPVTWVVIECLGCTKGLPGDYRWPCEASGEPLPAATSSPSSRCSPCPYKGSQPVFPWQTPPLPSGERLSFTVCANKHSPLCWRPDSGLFLHSVWLYCLRNLMGPRTWAQATRLVSKQLYQRSHLTSP